MDTLCYERVYFGLLGNSRISVYYPIIFYQRIEFYWAETIHMGIFIRNKGGSGNAIPVIAAVLIVRGKIFC